MSAPEVQADYDQLEGIAQNFSKEAGQTQRLMQIVRQCYGQLQGGDWKGVGADKFFNEMEEIVFPAIDRLLGALNEAASATKRISDAFQQAEEEGGGLFR
jgi:WXG100 family type VII secretion target